MERLSIEEFRLVKEEFSFWREGLRARWRERVSPFLKAAAAMLVGVLGVSGRSFSWGRAGEDCADGKGSVERKAWEEVLWREWVTREARLAIRVDFRLVDFIEGAALEEFVEVWVREAIEETDILRMELVCSFKGDGRRGAGLDGEPDLVWTEPASIMEEGRDRMCDSKVEEEGRGGVQGEVFVLGEMSTIMGLTMVKETALAVTSCDFLLDPLDAGTFKSASNSSPSNGSKSTSESESS